MKEIDYSVDNYLNAHLELAERLDRGVFKSCVDIIRKAFSSSGKVITLGNGGSAVAASNFITDWNKMGNLSTGKKFRGLSLCDNIGLITAHANDFSYEDVFSGQLAAILDPGDLVIAISCSGNSKNVINAVEYANKHGADTLGLLGFDGGKLKYLCNNYLIVPSNDMQLCEDVHMMFGHMVMKDLCSYSIVTGTDS
jgi:D-sedoheptulose 7-phosphate isomerase